MDIRELRRAAGLTQIELCSRVGVSRVRLSLAECGYVKLGSDEVAAIRDAALKEVETRVARLRDHSANLGPMP